MTRVTKSQAQNDRTVETLLIHHENGEYSQVRKLAGELVGKRGGEYSLIGLQYLGLSHFLEANYSEALPYFQRAARKSGSRTDHFNLLLCAVYLNDAKLESAMLVRMQDGVVGGQRNAPTEGQFRMYYCEALLESNRLAEAEAQFKSLLGIYARLQDIDDRYCRLNNLPSFMGFVATTEAIFKSAGHPHSAWEQWIDRIAASVRTTSVQWAALKQTH